MNGMDKLKPCPFCGEKASIKIYSNGFHTWFRVRCDSCGVAQDGIRNNEKQAIEAWNHRYEPSEQERWLNGE